MGLFPNEQQKGTEGVNEVWLSIVTKSSGSEVCLLIDVTLGKLFNFLTLSFYQ